MTVEEKVAILLDAKANGYRVTIKLTNGQSYGSLLVFEVVQPQICKIEHTGNVTTPTLPHLVRFATDNPKLVAFGTSVKRIEEITVHVS